MPSIRKLVEHLVNLFMIASVLSIIGKMLNIFFDIKSNENIVISFIFITTVFVLIFYPQISKKNAVAKYIASKMVRDSCRKLTIKDIMVIIVFVNLFALIIGVLLI